MWGKWRKEEKKKGRKKSGGGDDFFILFFFSHTHTHAHTRNSQKKRGWAITLHTRTLSHTHTRTHAHTHSLTFQPTSLPTNEMISSSLTLFIIFNPFFPKCHSLTKPPRLQPNSSALPQESHRQLDTLPDAARTPGNGKRVRKEGDGV